MNLEPVLTAPLVTQIHLAAALVAAALGLIQLLAPKGTVPHRTIGWIWVLLLGLVAISSFWIRELNAGGFSWIHALSVFTLIALVFAVRAARTHDIARHRTGMLSLYFGALIVTGAFTLAPGRLLHTVFFGG